MTDLPAGSRLAGFRSGLVGHILYDRGGPGAPGATGSFNNRFEGAWSPGAAYLAGDIVTSGGSSWLALADSTGVEPVDGATWTAVAVAGDEGVGVPPGGTEGQTLIKASGADYDTTWGEASGGGGGLLGSAYHNPATSSAYNTTAGGSPVDVDATNMAVTYEAPDVGRVIIVADVLIGGGSTYARGWLSLRQGSTDVAGTSRWVLFNPHQALHRYRARTSFLLEGLTPGATYTHKLAFRSSSSTMTLYVGGLSSEFTDTGAAGAGILEVWSA